MFEYIINNTARLHKPQIEYYSVILYRFNPTPKTTFYKGDFMSCFHQVNKEFSLGVEPSSIKVFKNNKKTSSNKCIFDLNL